MLNRYQYSIGYKIIYSILIVGLIASSFSCKNRFDSRKFWSDNNSPELIGNKVINDLLSRPELMIYNSKDFTVVHYAEVCAGFGAVQLAIQLHDTILINKLHSRYFSFLNDSFPIHISHVDASVLGILPLEFYSYNGNKKYLFNGLELANQQWQNPLSTGLSNQTRFWIDDIYMISILQIQAYKATWNETYLNRAAFEIDTYLKKLQQSNGLFYHGENAKFYWGRGNGWLPPGLAELIQNVPTNNPHYKSIFAAYTKMMAALQLYQTNDGMWRQLIDKKESWEESSCTAMFGYAIKVGINKGLLSRKKFSNTYQKAWLALVTHINKEGKLNDICVGTGQSNDIQYYMNRPKSIGDLHGQAPLLWFAYSLLKDSV